MSCSAPPGPPVRRRISLSTTIISGGIGQRGRAHQEFEQFVATCGDHLLRTGYLVVWDLGSAEHLVQECRIGDQGRIAR